MKKIFPFPIPTITFLLFLTFTACQPKDKSLDSLQDKVITKGYTGEFIRPQGNIQFAAINMMGVEDFLAFSPVESSRGFVIIKFRTNNEQTIREKLESILVFLDSYVSPQDRSEKARNAKEILEHKSLIHNEIMIIWETEEPTDITELIKSTY